MLPTHISTSTASPIHSTLSRLAKRGNGTRNACNVLGRRPFLRWVALLTILLSLAWLVLPYWGLPSSLEDIQHKLPFINRPAAPIEGEPKLNSPNGNAGIDIEDDLPKKVAPPSVDTVTPAVWKSRKEEVRNTFLYAWRGYMEKGFPSDEILPQAGISKNKFNGWSVTLVDSLSTMWLMDLKPEFNAAVDAIRQQKFNETANVYAPFFETVIRYLGGYLSGYALSGDKALLDLADDLGQKLLPVFSTKHGLPASAIQPSTGQIVGGSDYDVGLLAELGSCQLEYKYLAKLTGKPEYYQRVEAVMEHLYNSSNWNNLFAERWSLGSGSPSGTHYTIGAGTDSTYEYFLKQWLMFGDRRALDQYLKSVEGIIENLLFVTPKRKLLFVTDLIGKYATNKLEHLSCFLPGLIALGAHTIPADHLSDERRQRHKWAAEGLAFTCWITYADQQSGLGPDGATMMSGEKWVDELKAWEREGKQGKPPGLRQPTVEMYAEDRDYRNAWPEYWLMRPETIESIYILWKTTGDPIWRERGYGIYRAIEKHTKTEYGYSSVSHVDTDKPTIHDEMPSFFLAETLKYLYLLFNDEDPISFDKWVFNTEAHPLPVFNWTEEERVAFKVFS
ncbi:seven-hairpin glycosidase [Coprinopsis marcescibilis]|nr:seven-hairpin glycosidase [Coprinopsis marcescibilis]